jgi:hypothetical protein
VTVLLRMLALLHLVLGGGACFTALWAAVRLARFGKAMSAVVDALPLLAVLLGLGAWLLLLAWRLWRGDPRARHTLLVTHAPVALLSVLLITCGTYGWQRDQAQRWKGGMGGALAALFLMAGGAAAVVSLPTLAVALLWRPAPHDPDHSPPRDLP